MSQVAIKDRSPHSPSYQRHRPEQTLLYQIIERHYPEFRDVMAMQGKSLPLHLQQEFADTAYTPVGVELSLSIAFPVCQPPATDGAGAGDRLQGYIGPSYSETAVTDTLREYPLSTQNALQRWNHARHFRAAGFHCQACGAGAETESKPDPVPWRIRAQQQTPGRCDAG